LPGPDSPLLATFTIDEDILDVAGLADGRFVVVTRNTIHVFDPDVFQSPIQRTIWHDEKIDGASIRSDGVVATATSGGTIRVFDLSAVADIPQRTIDIAGEIGAIALSAGGRLAVARAGGTVALLDLMSPEGTEPGVVTIEDEDAVTALAWLSEDCLAVMYSVTYVLDLRSKTSRPIQLTDELYAFGLLGLADKQLAVMSADFGISIYDCSTLQPVHRRVLSVPDDDVHGVSQLPDGRLTAVGADGVLWIYDLASRSSAPTHALNAGGPSQAITALANGRAVVQMMDRGTLHIFDLHRQDDPEWASNPARSATWLAFLGDGSLAVGYANGSIRLLAASPGSRSLVRTLSCPSPPTELTELSNGFLAACDRDGQLHLFDWKAKSNKPERIVDCRSFLIGLLASSKSDDRDDAQRLLAVDGLLLDEFFVGLDSSSLALWEPELDSATLVRRLNLDGVLSAMTILRDGSLTIGTEAGIIWRLNPANPNALTSIADVAHAVECLTQDSEDRLWIGRSDGGIQYVDLRRLSPTIHTLAFLDAGVVELVVSPFGTLAARTTDGRVSVFDLIGEATASRTGQSRKMPSSPNYGRFRLNEIPITVTGQ
jgi:WD40 repeat protein